MESVFARSGQSISMSTPRRMNGGNPKSGRSSFQGFGMQLGGHSHLSCNPTVQRTPEVCFVPVPQFKGLILFTQQYVHKHMWQNMSGVPIIYACGFVEARYPNLFLVVQKGSPTENQHLWRFPASRDKRRPFRLKTCYMRRSCHASRGNRVRQAGPVLTHIVITRGKGTYYCRTDGYAARACLPSWVWFG